MSDMRGQIERFLDEEVRPLLKSHGGNVEVLSFEGHVLKIRLLGKCSGCPSAQITAEEMIGEKIRDKFKDIKEVILVQEVSRELIDFARKILERDRAYGYRN